jgi:hypothetical protein
MPAAKEKTYKFLNPVGTHETVNLMPLAPRLDKNKLDGKTIYISVGAGGEQGMMIPLPKWCQANYPNVNWKVTYAPPHATIAGSESLSDEEMKTADAMIRGVLW